MYLLSIKESIDSAHKLTNYVGKCHNLHGHRFEIEVVLKFKDEEIKSNNVLIDFKDVKGELKTLLAEYDHQYLNEVLKEDDVTAEFLSKDIYKKLKIKLPNLFHVTVYETANNGLTYFGGE